MLFLLSLLYHMPTWAVQSRREPQLCWSTFCLCAQRFFLILQSFFSISRNPCSTFAGQGCRVSPSNVENADCLRTTLFCSPRGTLLLRVSIVALGKGAAATEGSVEECFSPEKPTGMCLTRSSGFLPGESPFSCCSE